MSYNIHNIKFSLISVLKNSYLIEVNFEQFSKPWISSPQTAHPRFLFSTFSLESNSWLGEWQVSVPELKVWFFSPSSFFDSASRTSSSIRSTWATEICWESLKGCKSGWWNSEQPPMPQPSVSWQSEVKWQPVRQRAQLPLLWRIVSFSVRLKN